MFNITHGVFFLLFCFFDLTSQCCQLKLQDLSIFAVRYLYVYTLVFIYCTDCVGDLALYALLFSCFIYVKHTHAHTFIHSIIKEQLNAFEWIFNVHTRTHALNNFVIWANTHSVSYRYGYDVMLVASIICALIHTSYFFASKYVGERVTERVCVFVYDSMIAIFSFMFIFCSFRRKLLFKWPE